LRLLGVVVAALVLAPAAAADVRYGVADDFGKYSEDGGEWFYSQLATLGAADNRVTVVLEPGQAAISDDDDVRLKRIGVSSRRHGVRLVLAVYARRFSDYSPDAICGNAERAVDVSGARHVIVGNEVNKGLDPATYVSVLGACMDRLGPRGVTVIGGALSARKTTAASMSPLEYIAAMGRAYKAQPAFHARQAPLMHRLAVNPYPNPERRSQGIDAGYDWPGAGVTQLARIYQAFEDAFAGTAQPTFGNGLLLWITEYGHESTPGEAQAHLYRGTEVSQTVSEQEQAQLYGDWLRYVACDPLIEAAYTFLLVGEADLGGAGLGQTSLLHPELSRKPSYEAVRGVLSATGGRCTGAVRAWSPATGVVGASSRTLTRVVGKQRFSRIEFSADEGVRFQLKVQRDGKTVLSKSGEIRTTARNVLAAQATPRQIGRGRYQLRLTDLGSARVSLLTGVVPSR
jgi:hypothetical protein